ncbi:1-acyl-sn-glycerol-3-phosphate acyltransferase [Gammaproteobacteria bacterium]|nr:1-acyl-sn-glycerol-3-phosphate acyltransferase [bacterium]MDA9340620.1 1-acyl-sn-glycerol-3-phosphate acyltransferase [Gammaproteobacteria bacterium]MDB4277925.1 1-acyl-sn-glycerol-3-phosphate acyltransferase [Gammaproteobacteria bacterium]MDB9701084.1 1-acyl-sn-glycerol-3-phosphate acyltransferase [Gammaproteobacteria bacterium]MDC1326433.1 1-acyl-sn-glycerol-3-phosphate acyltransferase [Gammaproteobacteria bacterium]|tara:strand:+ start:4152 stop:5279 length:1128 start_codon:yes stop_codon:yes gene_type:complete
MDPFKAIRPYQNHEVQAILSRLINNPDVLRALLGLKYPAYALKIPFFQSLIKLFLKLKARQIRTVDDYQDIFKGLMDHVIESSTSQLTLEGDEHLDPGSSYLFISNHRDIALDAAFLNLLLSRKGHTTFNIAVGNNLMEEDWASDLMRLNKSFIIQRSGASKKEIYSGLALASQFIQETIFHKDESVWIAQKQGRAKDGVDQTDPALLKMIHLAERKSKPIAEYFNSLKVVPISISYELDPNDRLKAFEVAAGDSDTPYIKEKNEDLKSIAHGVQGFKGHVHIAISDPLTLSSEITYEDLATLITNKIVSNYYLHPTNYAAYEMLNPGSSISKDHFDPSHIQELSLRLEGLSDSVRSKLLEQYANPLIQQTLLNN